MSKTVEVDDVSLEELEALYSSRLDRSGTWRMTIDRAFPALAAELRALRAERDTIFAAVNGERER